MGDRDPNATEAMRALQQEGAPIADSLSIWRSLANLRRLGFIRSVTVLVGGTAFAQALTVLALPLLTRLYSPSDLGLLAVYAALLGMISVAACLRFDIAIPLPKQDDEAASLLAAALLSGAGTSLLVGLSVLIAPRRIALLIGTPSISAYLWLLPIGVFFAATSGALQFWATRKRAFGRIARVRVEQAVGGVTAQVGLGLLGIAPVGLIIGQVINGGAGFIGLGRSAIKEDNAALRSVNIPSIKRIAKAYDRFPKFSTLDALANVASIQLPMLLIAAQTTAREAGFLLLAMRVMQAPMGIVGSAISQVYLARAPDEYRADRLPQFTERVLSGLLRSGVGPLLFIGIVAPNVFDTVFGVQWHRAGQLLLWMTPWFVMQFLVSPISMVLHVRNKQHIALALNAFGVVWRVLPIEIAVYYGYRHALPEILAISSVLFYASWFVYCLKVSGTSIRAVFAQRYSASIVMAWAILGVTIKILLTRFPIRGI